MWRPDPFARNSQIGLNLTRGIKQSISTAVAASMLAIAGSLLLCGCEPPTAKLTQGYKLERFDENGKYYIVARGDLSGGGVLDGTVEQVGWNQDWILARVTKLYHGDTNGWYALDLKTEHVVGPIQDSEVKTNAAWSKIDCREAGQVFLEK